MSKPAICPACSSAASGKFCANCGAALGGSSCTGCSRPLTTGARFCSHCGTTAGGAGKGVSAPPGTKAFVWLVPGIAVLALVAFLIGQRVGRPETAPEATAPPGGGAAPFAGGGGTAPDISQMSPEERATRLFDRVMRYSEEGKQDSARIFAPMATQAYEMLGALDAHNRYDIGLIAFATGDAGAARAQADTILKQNATHLLGLVLAMKAAGMRNDNAARVALEKRFRAAERTERAKNLKEYSDHAKDLDAALTPAGGRKP